MTQKELDEIIEIIGTHTEHYGDYCDTGADMDWACRSECVDMAIKRLRGVMVLKFRKENGFE